MDVPDTSSLVVIKIIQEINFYEISRKIEGVEKLRCNFKLILEKFLKYEYYWETVAYQETFWYFGEILKKL